MIATPVPKLIFWLEDNKQKHKHNLEVYETGRATPRIEAEIEVYEYIENLVNNA